MGAAAQDGLPAEERKGVLWDAMRALTAQGWEPDTYSYSTAFRRAAAAAACALECCMPCSDLTYLCSLLYVQCTSLSCISGIWRLWPP